LTIQPPVSSVVSIATTVTGAELVTGDSTGAVTLFDSATGSQLGTPLGSGGIVQGVAFSPTASLVASANSDGVLTLWDVGSRRSLGMTATAYPLHGVAVDSGGRSAVVATADRTINRVGLTDPSTVRLYQPGWSPNALAVSRDGGTIAASDDEGGVHLVTVGSRVPAPSPDRSLPEAQFEFGVALAAGDQIVAAGDDKGAVREWNVVTGAPVGTPYGQAAGTAVGLASSSDGSLLAVGDTAGQISFWDTGTRARRNSPVHIGGYVVSLAFSPDGRTLAAGGRNGAVTLWDVDTGHQLGGPLLGHAHPVLTVRFTDDGMSLASIDNHGVMIRWPSILWTRDVRALVNAACAAARRTLTRAEWSTYLPNRAYDPPCTTTTSQGRTALPTAATTGAPITAPPTSRALPATTTATQPPATSAHQHGTVTSAVLAKLLPPRGCQDMPGSILTLYQAARGTVCFEPAPFPAETDFLGFSSPADQDAAWSNRVQGVGMTAAACDDVNSPKPRVCRDATSTDPYSRVWWLEADTGVTVQITSKTTLAQLISWLGSLAT
jgi:hypothetical protein